MQAGVQYILKLGHELYLVDKQIVGFVVFHALANESQASIRITQLHVDAVVKLNLNDVRRLHPRIQKVLLEEAEQQIGLS